MSALTWATDKPTEPGWYWWRPIDRTDGEFTRVVYVYKPVQFMRGLSPGVDGMVKLLPGQWSGPIPEPEEAK